jgi:hypothetical protein
VTVFIYLRDEVLEDGHPLYRKLRRRINEKEYREAVELARNAEDAVWIVRIRDRAVR